jgi:hypothetical protein
MRLAPYGTVAASFFLVMAVAAESPVPPVPADQFDTLVKLIKPAPGESKWAEIPWLLDVYDAQKKAAEEGKPILIWSAGGGQPIGSC